MNIYRTIFISIILTIIFTIFDPILVLAQGSEIARLSFDDTGLDLGVEDYQFYRNSKGFIDVSQNIYLSGNKSLEIQEKSFDGNFVELQGQFPTKIKGVLHFSFAFLVENPKETFNVALAGPEHFSMRKNGMSFWLSSKNGILRHYSDSIPKKLMKIEPYEWYFVDLLLYLEEGLLVNTPSLVI